MLVCKYVAEILYEDGGWEVLCYESKAVKGKLLSNDRECLLDFLFMIGYDLNKLDHLDTKQLEQVCLSRGVYVQLVD